MYNEQALVKYFRNSFAKRIHKDRTLFRSTLDGDRLVKISKDSEFIKADLHQYYSAVGDIDFDRLSLAVRKARCPISRYTTAKVQFDTIFGGEHCGCMHVVRRVLI